jgi:hypothetical protein
MFSLLYSQVPELESVSLLDDDGHDRHAWTHQTHFVVSALHGSIAD